MKDYKIDTKINEIQNLDLDNEKKDYWGIEIGKEFISIEYLGGDKQYNVEIKMNEIQKFESSAEVKKFLIEYYNKIK